MTPSPFRNSTGNGPFRSGLYHQASHSWPRHHRPRSVGQKSCHRFGHNCCRHIEVCANEAMILAFDDFDDLPSLIITSATRFLAEFDADSIARRSIHRVTRFDKDIECPLGFARSASGTNKTIARRSPTKDTGNLARGMSFGLAMIGGDRRNFVGVR